MTDLLPKILAFASAHPEVTWLVVSAVLGLTLKALAESKNPYAQGVYHALVALGIDLPKLLAAARMIFQAITGKTPPSEPPSKGPLYQPPASRESEEVTLPRGPRGVATIRSLVAALLAASFCALPLSAGCGARPLVVHVVDRADGVCPEVVIVLPEIGPVCTLLHTVDRLLELLAAAQAAGTGLTVEVDGHRVTIPPGKIEEVRAGVAGARTSVRRSVVPVSSGSAR